MKKGNQNVVSSGGLKMNSEVKRYLTQYLQPGGIAEGNVIRHVDCWNPVIDEIERYRNEIRRKTVPINIMMLQGPTGVGKEYAARLIHNVCSREPNKVTSEQKEFPKTEDGFLAQNCASLNSSLVQSKLFGHVKGAYTDATNNHDGLFVRSNDGTLFLDEIHHLSDDTLDQLLRVLIDGEVQPIGSEKGPRSSFCESVPLEAVPTPISAILA